MSMTPIRYWLSDLRKKLWVRPTLLSIAALTWVSVSFSLQYFLREDFPVDIERDTLTELFAILASSMLAVATFAVSALVGAFSSVSGSSTPRARVLVVTDSTAQNALASFIGAFIYSVVSLVALSTLSYGTAGRFGLFVGFIIAVAFVLMSFLRWVALVSTLGGLDDTIDRAEKVATEVFSSPTAIGGLGAHEYALTTPRPTGTAILAPETGYLCYIDIDALNALAERLGGEMWLCARPGGFLHETRPIAILVANNAATDEDIEAARGAFTFAKSRDMKLDPRFALIVIAEIADNALAPAHPNSGTVLRVLGVQLRILSRWAKTRTEADDRKVDFPRVYLPALDIDDLIDDAFLPVISGGAPLYDVSLRLQKTFRDLERIGHPELSRSARRAADTALKHALNHLPLDYQKDKLREYVESVSR